jgi:hypothetical protein
LSLSFSVANQAVSQSFVNPVIWKTAYNEFASSNFYIQIGQKSYYGSDRVLVRSDPGIDNTTLELDWTEKGIQMRLYFYFTRIDNLMWQLTDLRSYNNTGNDWIYYQTSDTNGNPVRSLLGQRNFHSERTFLSTDGQAQIHCKDCSLTAFINNLPPPSIHGYSLDFRIGIPQNETITLTTEPNTGYGVNAVLFDSSGKVVADQSGLTYSWKTENTSIVNFYPISVPYPNGMCAYGIQAPCPYSNVQLSGSAPGVTRMILDVVRQSDSKVIATGFFPVRVVDENTQPPLNPIPGDINGDGLVDGRDYVIWLVHYGERAE